MQLLEHFKELTVHPKNAEELKGLILQLAIQGKLVDDNKNWHFGTLSDLGIWAVGNGFPKAFQGNDTGEIPFIKVSDMNLKSNSKFITKSNNYISKEVALKIRAKIHPPGTVVFPKIGGAIATNKRRVLTIPTSIDNNCLGLIPNEKTTSEWLFLVLSGIDLSKYQSGTSVPSLSQKIIEKIPSSIPPLEEQKAIVSTVNQLFKEVEELELQTKARIQLKEDFVTSALQQLAKGDAASEWSFLQEHFRTFFTEKTAVKKLRESILQLAVQGKLTTHWRSGHPELVEGQNSAKALLDKIKAEKAQLIKDKKIKKEKPLPEITEDEIPYALPEGWEWCRMRDISYSIVPNRDKPKSFTGDITWLTTRNLEKQSNKIYSKGSDNKLSREELIDYNARLLPTHSVIMSCVGQFGLSAILDKEYSCNQQLHCFVPLGRANPNYMDYLIKNGKKTYEDMSSATTIAYLNKTKCESLPISLPPLDEQIAIVAKVNALMALCDTLEKEIEQNTHHLEQLMQSCLREVFEGKGS